MYIPCNSLMTRCVSRLGEEQGRAVKESKASLSHEGGCVGDQISFWWSGSINQTEQHAQKAEFCHWKCISSCDLQQTIFTFSLEYFWTSKYTWSPLNYNSLRLFNSELWVFVLHPYNSIFPAFQCEFQVILSEKERCTLLKTNKHANKTQN